MNMHGYVLEEEFIGFFWTGCAGNKASGLNELESKPGRED